MALVREQMFVDGVCGVVANDLCSERLQTDSIESHSVNCGITSLESWTLLASEALTILQTSKTDGY
jgi:hypothetical protein